MGFSGSPRTRVSVFNSPLKLNGLEETFLTQKWRRDPYKCTGHQHTDNVLNQLLSVNVSTLIMLEIFLNYE